MPEEIESARKRGRKRGGAKRGTKRAKKAAADDRPLGAREPRQLSPEELETLRQRLQRKFR
jgi:hypothetical protein